MLLNIRRRGESSDACQMQDKVDYLSEKRRLHYQNWKKATLLRIVELEQSEEIEDEAQ